MIYSCSVNYRFQSLTPSPYSQVSFYFTCAPENVEKVISRIKLILKDMLESKISDKELKAVKKVLINNCKESMQGNFWWSWALKDLIKLEQDFSTILDYKKHAEELTPEIFQNNARKYLDETNMIIAILNPKKENK